MQRREFLKAGAIAAAFPQIVSAGVLGRGGLVPPSERIAIGCIGTGNMGRHDMGEFIRSKDARIVAVCDVKRDARELAKSLVDEYYDDTACAAYVDFRELCAQDDIDAVQVASTDCWHVLHALEAVRAGKDVYVEKPLGVSVEEVQALRKAVKRYGRIFQFGTQQRSSANFRQACELVRNGRIGKVHAIEVGVHAGAAERSGLRSYTPQPVPDGLDYDLWLGPAPDAPYVPERVKSPHWFHISDYSLGYIAGWGIHHIDIAQWGNGTEDTGPVEVEGKADFPLDDALCDNPVSWDVHYRYANGVRMHFTGSGPGFDGVRHGITFIGDEGRIWVNRGALEAEPASLLQEQLGPDEIHLHESSWHQQDLLNAIRTRGATVSHIDTAVRSDMVCHVGWIAFQLRRKLRWDPEAEIFPGDDEANRMLRRPMRGPWRL